MELTPEQLEVVVAVTGPVRVLAGAGTGKTTVLTHRIAHQVRSGAFPPRSILAVTFTRAAAKEMRSKLAGLEVDGPVAGTFHATAHWMLAKWWPSWHGADVPQHLKEERWLLEHLGAVSGRSIWDAKADIQWLKRQRARPDNCLQVLADKGHRPRLEPALLADVFEGYERAKETRGLIDYQDMLEHCIRLLEEHAPAADWVREAFKAFTVDEYQDLDPLQHALLEHWVGDSQEICVVGDPYQSIFGFAGASGRYLEDFLAWRPEAATHPLTVNFRSTSEVLGPANALAAGLSAPPRLLQGTTSGVVPVIRGFPDDTRRTRWIAEEISRLIAEHRLDPAQITVLYRWQNSGPYERALTEKGIPHAVIGDPAFLDREHIRRAVIESAAAPSWDEALESVHRSSIQLLDEDDLVPAEVILERTQDLFELEELVRECMETMQLAPQNLPEWLLEKYGTEETGVQLMTLHKAKGLEFDAVFLPEVERGKLPAFFSGDEDEERRVLYVGLTRARRHLYVTWSEAEGASPFIQQLT